MKSETQKLKDALKKLHQKHDSDEIFTALVSIAEESDASDAKYLQDEVISYLNYKGMNVIKLSGLTQRIDFEEKMAALLPFDNDKQESLFTAY